MPSITLVICMPHAAASYEHDVLTLYRELGQAL